MYGVPPIIAVCTAAISSLASTPNTVNPRISSLSAAISIFMNPRGSDTVLVRSSTAANVWAMGECAGSPQFTHVAFDDFRVVHDNLNGGSSTTTDRLVPYCMFTDPELARVGCNETEARRRGIGYRVLTLSMAAVLRTRTLSEPRGFMKLLIAANSDEIIGFTVFGAEGSELMAAVQTAMIGRVPYTALGRAIYAHPTAAEGLTFLLRNEPTVPAR